MIRRDIYFRCLLRSTLHTVLLVVPGCEGSIEAFLNRIGGGHVDVVRTLRRGDRLRIKRSCITDRFVKYHIRHSGITVAGITRLVHRIEIRIVQLRLDSVVHASQTFCQNPVFRVIGITRHTPAYIHRCTYAEGGVFQRLVRIPVHLEPRYIVIAVRGFFLFLYVQEYPRTRRDHAALTGGSVRHFDNTHIRSLDIRATVAVVVVCTRLIGLALASVVEDLHF